MMPNLTNNGHRPTPRNESEYLRALLEMGFSRTQVDKWLNGHPKPDNWLGGPYSYAYAEMPAK